MSVGWIASLSLCLGESVGREDTLVGFTKTSHNYTDTLALVLREMKEMQKEKHYNKTQQEEGRINNK